MSEDINSEIDNEPPQIRQQTPSNTDVVGDDFTAEAQRALAELVAYPSGRIDLLLRFGKAVAIAKKELPHGKFKPWCLDSLNRAPSWCCTHRRLYERRDDLKLARNWAKETGHRWADCHSVERLLRLIDDWDKTDGGRVSAPKARRKNSEIIADLKKQLADAKADFEPLRDPLPPEIDVRARELAAPAAASDVAAKEELAEIARRFHWRYGDLVHRDTCSAQQVSKPAPEVSAGAQPDAPKTDQPTSDEASAPRDQGNPPDSPHVTVAPATTPVDLGSAPLREEQRPQSQNGIGGTKLARTTQIMPPHFGKRADSRFSSKK